jgi:hypothetical protein
VADQRILSLPVFRLPFISSFSNLEVVVVRFSHLFLLHNVLQVFWGLFADEGGIFLLFSLDNFGGLMHLLMVLLGPCLVLVGRWGDGFVLVLWIFFVVGGDVVEAEGDVFLGFPGVEAFVVALPLDEAVLPVCMCADVLLIHFIWMTRSTS